MLTRLNHGLKKYTTFLDSIISAAMDHMQRLTERVTKQCLRIKKGEKILVEAIHLDDLRLPELLSIQCANLGANPILVVRPEKVDHLKLLRLKPEDSGKLPIT